MDKQNQTTAEDYWGCGAICPKLYQGCPAPVESKDIFLNVCSRAFQGCHDNTVLISRADFIALGEPVCLGSPRAGVTPKLNLADSTG